MTYLLKQAPLKSSLQRLSKKKIEGTLTKNKNGKSVSFPFLQSNYPLDSRGSLLLGYVLSS